MAGIVTSGLALLTLSAAASAEDVLYSKRSLEKRYVDADGNWNQCVCDEWKMKGL